MDQGDLFFASGTSIERVSTSGGAAQSLAPGGGSFAYLAVDATHVYWSEALDPSAIKRVPRAGGPVETLASDLSASDGLQLDDTAIYWGEHSGSVYRLAK